VSEQLDRAALLDAANRAAYDVFRKRVLAGDPLPVTDERWAEVREGLARTTVDPEVTAAVADKVTALLAGVIEAKRAEVSDALNRLANTVDARDVAEARLAEVERERDELQGTVEHWRQVAARHEADHAIAHETRRKAEARLAAVREASKRHPPKAWGARAQYSDGWDDAMNKISAALAVPAGAAQPDEEQP